HDITMGPGEVAEFDTRLPHWFGPSGDEPVEILSVHGSHGQRMHVRAAPRGTTGSARIGRYPGYAREVRLRRGGGRRAGRRPQEQTHASPARCWGPLVFSA